MENILVALKEERDRLDKVICILEGKNKKPGPRGRRHMSAEARARISKAMKARWAQRKRKAA